MNTQEFKSAINEIVPIPDDTTTQTWHDICVSAQEDGEDFLKDTCDALAFIKKYFSAEIAQKAYSITQYGTNILPWELVSAAFFLATGVEPQDLADDDGARLQCLKIPDANQEPPYALLVFVVNGEEHTTFTAKYGEVDLEKWLQIGKGVATGECEKFCVKKRTAYNVEKECLEDAGLVAHWNELFSRHAYDTLLLLAPDGTVSDYMGNRFIAGTEDEPLTQAIRFCYENKRCAAISTCVTICVDAECRIDMGK